MAHINAENVQMNGSDIFVSGLLIEQANAAEVTRQIPLIIFLLLISLTGIPGNGLVCYIYHSKYSMSSSRWFIFFLAFVDLILCILIVPCEIATTFQQYNFTDETWCKLSTFLNLWALLSLGLTLVIVSIDRYRKVCKPLGWQIHFSKARILCVIAVVFSFLISLPVFSVYDIHEFTLKDYNVNASECSFRKSNDESNFAFMYVTFGMLMFTCALITICVLYCFIGGEIKQHTNKERVKRHLSLTASMARKSDHIRPVTAVSVGKSVKFGEMKVPSKSVKFDEQQIQKKAQEQWDATSNEAEESSTNNMSEEDTYDFDIPKRPMTRAQKTKSKRMRRARARKATYSMFLISLAFVLSYLPFLSLLLARSVKSNFDESMSKEWRAVYKFFVRSYFLNCAINPFIYGIADSKFRQSCKDVLYDIKQRFWECFKIE